MKILLYHGVTDKLDAFEKVFQKHISISDFREQISYAKKHYHLISLEEFIQGYENRTLDDSSAMVCFDDCYRDVMIAAEILHDERVPAFFSIASDLVDRNYSWTDDIEKVIINTTLDSIDFADFHFDLSTEDKKFRTVLVLKDYFKNLFVEKNKMRLAELVTVSGVSTHDIKHEKFDIITWSQVWELANDALFKIIPHSHSHYPLSKYSTMEHIGEDLVKNIDALDKQEVNFVRTVFAYPFGMVEHYDWRAKQALANLGFKHAFAVNNRVVDYDDPMSIPRLELTLQRFGQMVRV